MDVARQLTGEVAFVDRPDGARLRTVRGGDGPISVVLAHGYGVNLDEWNVVTELLGDVGWLAYDMRAHGESTAGSDGVSPSAMAGDLSALLDHFDVQDAVLVGHSTGGFVAIRCVLDHAEVARQRLAGCLLVASYAGDVGRSNPQNRVQIPLIKSGLLVGGLRWSWFAHTFVRSLAGDDFDAAYVEPFVRAFRKSDHRALVPLLQAIVAESDYARLPEIDLPFVILVGSKDKTTPPFHATDMNGGIAGSRLRRLDGKGHLLNWEAPHEVVEEIRALLP